MAFHSGFLVESANIADLLSEANNKNQQLESALSKANILLETLRTESEKQAKFREKSTDLMQRILDSITAKVIASEKKELEKKLKTASLSTEEKLVAQNSKKELEEQMKNWLDDAKRELSECLNRDTLHRIKIDVNRELTDRQLEIKENQCEKLKIETQTLESKTNQLQEIITDYDRKLITEQYEKQIIVKDLKMAEERQKTAEKETVINKLQHDKEAIEKENIELREQFCDKEKRTELLVKEGLEAEKVFKSKLQGLQEELVSKQEQLEEIICKFENEKHKHQIKIKTLQSELDDMVIELEREKKLKDSMEVQMQRLKADLDKGMFFISIYKYFKLIISSILFLYPLLVEKKLGGICVCMCFVG